MYIVKEKIFKTPIEDNCFLLDEIIISVFSFHKCFNRFVTCLKTSGYEIRFCLKNKANYEVKDLNCLRSTESVAFSAVSYFTVDLLSSYKQP